MLSSDPSHWMHEVRGATDHRDRFLSGSAELISRYHGRFYRSDAAPDRPIPENHAFEYVALLCPQIAFAEPRVNITSLEPGTLSPADEMSLQQILAQAGVGSIEELAEMVGAKGKWELYDALGIEPMGVIADGLETAINTWSLANETAELWRDIVVDFAFSYGVVMTSVGDQHGRSPGLRVRPQQPYITQIAPNHFIMDPKARNADPMRANGPRWMGHIWTGDVDDLMADDDFDKDMVEALTVDGELWEETKKSGWGVELSRSINAPKRSLVAAWDIWVAEHHEDNEQGFNGTIYTLGIGVSDEGFTGRPRWIREPRPAFCPPWGPYTVIGAYRVPGSPIPLSPLTATAEQAEELNSHVTAAAEDARNFKRFAYGPNTNRADGERIMRVRHGQYIGLDEPGNVGQMELGGVSDSQYHYIETSRDRLNRVSGISDAMRGEVTKGVTATGESVAQQAGTTRIASVKQPYLWGVSRVMKSVAWVMFHGAHQMFAVQSRSKHQFAMKRFQGGYHLKGLEFFDMSITVDPLSIEHTNQAMLQQRMQKAFEILSKAAPQMINAPFIRWREPIEDLFQSLDIHDVDRWIDDALLAKMQGFGLLNKAGVMGAIQQGQIARQPPGMGGSRPDAMAEAGQNAGQVRSANVPMMG